MLVFIYNIVRVYCTSRFFYFWFPYVFAMFVLCMIVYIIRRILDV